MKTRIIGAALALVLAIVGTVVLVGYARGADQRAAQGAEFVDVFVVDDTVPKGMTGAEVGEFVSEVQLPALSVADDHVTDLADLDGLVANADLLPGEQLLSGRFVDPVVLAAQGDVAVPAGMQEVTVALDVQRVVGGAVRPGSTVGVVVTNKLEPAAAAPDGTVGTMPATRFVLQKVLVTRVQAGSTYTPEQESEGTSKVNAVQSIMVTFALLTPDVERVVWAREMQEDDFAGIWLTLQPEDVNVDGSELVEPGNILP